MTGRTPPRLVASPEQIARVRDRYERTNAAAARSGLAKGLGIEDIFVTFPHLRAALDELPETSTLFEMEPEIRALVLEALADEGVDVGVLARAGWR